MTSPPRSNLRSKQVYGRNKLVFGTLRSSTAFFHRTFFHNKNVVFFFFSFCRSLAKQKLDFLIKSY